MEAPPSWPFEGPGMIPFEPLVREATFGKGGSNEVFSASRGIAGCGGTYAGYFEVISWRKT